MFINLNTRLFKNINKYSMCKKLNVYLRDFNIINDKLTSYKIQHFPRYTLKETK